MPVLWKQDGSHNIFNDVSEIESVKVSEHLNFQFLETELGQTSVF